MPEQSKEPEVLIPEVLPPEGGRTGERREHSGGSSFNPKGWIHPILAGLILDILSTVVSGKGGFFLGALCGFYLLGVCRLPFSSRLLWALAAGIYCTLRYPHFYPAATIILFIWWLLNRKR